jgi:hypothetical protein
MKTSITVFFTMALAIFSGCKQKTTSNVDAGNEIRFDSIHAIDKYYLLGDESNPSCSVDMQLIYPVAGKDAAILAKLTQHLVSAYFGEDAGSIAPEQALKESVSSVIAGYKDLESDFDEAKKSSDDVTSLNYWVTSSNSVNFNNFNLLGFTINIGEYNGGAHENYTCSHLLLNALTGEQISEEEIFTDGCLDALSAIIVEALTSKYKLEKSADLEGEGFFNVAQIAPNNNFIICDKGITYTYNDYEIAPHSVGRIDVFLPYDKIRSLVRKDSPLAPLISK